MSWKDNFPKENRYFETENGILYLSDNKDILPLIETDTINLIITDPPYGVNSNELNGIDYIDNFYDVDFISKELYRILKNNSRCYVFTAQKTLIEVIIGFIENGFKLHQILVWFRPNLAGGTNKKTYDYTSVYENILNFHKGKPKKLKIIDKFNNTDVFLYAQPQSNFNYDKRFHIHQKPIKLIEHIIEVSTDNNDIILDCFSGSGTTLVACEKLNRRWIGIEINEKYCEITKS